MSDTAPAGNCVRMRIGRLGNADCACAKAAANPSVIAVTTWSVVKTALNEAKIFMAA